MKAETPEYMTISEVSEIFRISRNTIWILVRSGKVPAVRIGKSWRIPRAAVEAYATEK